MGDDGGLDEGRCGGITKKWSDSRCNSKAVLRGFADILVLEYKKSKEGVKHDSKTDIQ